VRAKAQKRSKRFGPAGIAGLLTALGLLLLVPAAEAAPPQLWQKCDSDEPAGQQCFPRGIAANPNNGHVFVSNQVNGRIVEFDPLGQFVRAWGWDVVASGPGDTGTGFEVCQPEDGDTCKGGTQGAAAGQFSELPQGVALDSAGYVYAVDFSNRRVQKFSPAGQFLLMFGGDVNKTKVEAAALESERNVCPVDPGDVCQKGAQGTGNGQFGAWVIGSFIAIDDNGTTTVADDEVWVGDEDRIQRFDTSGVYQGQIALPGKTVQSLAVDTAGNLYAAYQSQVGVHKLSPSGESLSPAFEFPKPDAVTTLFATAVAVDAAGHVFAFTTPPTGNGFAPLDRIYEFDPSGDLVDSFGKGEFHDSTGLATNLCEGSEAPGNLYVSDLHLGEGTKDFVRAYGTPPTGCVNAETGTATNIEEGAATLNGTVKPKGSPVSECRFEYGLSATPYEGSVPCAESSGEIGTGSSPVPVHTDLSGLEEGTVYHFRLVATIGGATEKGSDAIFKTLGPPILSAEQTVSVVYTEASLKALVNPEGLSTTYHFEYGPDTSYGKSTPEIAIGSDRKEHAALADLEGLAPDTSYHWRIVAINQSGATEGEDHLFTTYRLFVPKVDCANQAFRSADAAFLPDCRAYEMVSPIDKNGRDLTTSLRETVQVSPDGDRLTYPALPSFGDQPSNAGTNQYLASREGDGWSNHGIHPPLEGKTTPGVQLGFAKEFTAFSADLCSAWLVDYQTPPLTADGQPGYRNLYRYQNCGPGAGGPEALAPAPPPLPEGTAAGYVTATSVQGVSADSRHVLFLAKTQLTPDAAAGTNSQIYDRFEGELSLVSVLPSGEASTAVSVVGSDWDRNLDHAVSEDGSLVYWTAGGNTGQIYLRRHPEQGIVAGECSEAAMACTVPVSATNQALFWGAAADGSKVLFSEGNLQAGTAKLYEFDLAAAEGSEPLRLVAEDVRGVLGAGDDLTRFYFVSTEALPSTGKNSEEDEAIEGEPNIYLEEEGEPSFVGTLVKRDLGGVEPGGLSESYSVVDPSSRQRSTRVTPDGRHLLFQSRAPLTGFNNTDANGKLAVEVFAYEAGGELHCISCNPSGARPETRELQPPFVVGWVKRPSDTLVYAAAWIPGWERPLYDSKLLSDDGGRAFFNSHDALVPRDVNDAMDVYQWATPGKGSCTTASPSYFPANGGCVDLISSGESPFESEFWGASPDGEDVFFTTSSSLLPQDPGLIDLYDARVGGGLPQPIEKALCEGEACQSPPAPPTDPTPGSATFEGVGNLREGTSRARCPKGKRRVVRRGKARCVKPKRSSKRAQHKRRANHNRRAAR
jgi:DNA-binding beta-propeller fold protein YncE